MSRSLRTGLVRSVLLAVALLLTAFGVGVYLLARWGLVKEFDAGLAATAQALTTYAEVSKGQITIDVEVEDFRQFAAGSKRAFYQFWGPNGEILHRSPSLRGGNMSRYACRPNKPSFYAVTLPNRRPGRVLAREFQPRPEAGQQGDRPTLTLVVGHDTHELDERLTGLAWLLAGAGGATMLTATLAAALAVKRGLLPVRGVVAGIEAVNADGLDQRVPTDAIPGELLPVVEKLNDMLARLQGAFARERTFTSDVAHELRTPLAGARATFEVALSRPRQADEYAQALRDGLAALLPMQALVGNLMTLTRLDSGQASLERQEMDLVHLARTCWNDLAARARARRLRLEEDFPAKLVLVSDPQCLLLILRNLLDNAVTYADSGGLIHLAASSGAGGVELSVANTGCTLTQADLPRVFDRFWRGDVARTDTGLHCGLGLSLLQRAVEALGGTVWASIEAPATFVVRVKLPSAC